MVYIYVYDQHRVCGHGRVTVVTPTPDTLAQERVQGVGVATVTKHSPGQGILDPNVATLTLEPLQRTYQGILQGHVPLARALCPGGSHV